MVNYLGQSVLVIPGDDRYGMTKLMDELARRVNGCHINHLAHCLPGLADFPLEAYRPADLVQDLRTLLDREGKTLIVSGLEWILAVWPEPDQRRFLQMMATFAHRHVLVIVCQLSLDYETQIGNQGRVFRL